MGWSLRSTCPPANFQTLSNESWAMQWCMFPCTLCTFPFFAFPPGPVCSSVCCTPCKLQWNISGPNPPVCMLSFSPSCLSHIPGLLSQVSGGLSQRVVLLSVEQPCCLCGGMKRHQELRVRPVHPSVQKVELPRPPAAAVIDSTIKWMWCGY